MEEVKMKRAISLLLVLAVYPDKSVTPAPTPE